MWRVLSTILEMVYGVSTRFLGHLSRILFSFGGKPSLPPPPLPKSPRPRSISPLLPPTPRTQQVSPHIIIDMDAIAAVPLPVPPQPQPQQAQSQMEETNTNTESVCASVEIQGASKMSSEATATATDTDMSMTPTPKRKSSIPVVTDDPAEIKKPKLSKIDKRHERRQRSKNKKAGETETFQSKEEKANVKVKDTKMDSRPNYFVAFPVSDLQIIQRVKEFQERMTARPVLSMTNCKTGASFRETLISIPKLHFTLNVLQLNNAEHISSAVDVLRNVCEKIKKDTAEKLPLQLKLKGLGHFKNSVLFAKIDGQEDITFLEHLAATLVHEFKAQLDTPGDNKTFQPHMTIAKMSKAKKLSKRRIRSFPPEIWADDENLDFGEQKVDSLQLLSMIETDPVTQYYKIIAEFKITAPSDDKSSSEIPATLPT